MLRCISLQTPLVFSTSPTGIPLCIVYIYAVISVQIFYSEPFGYLDMRYWLFAFLLANTVLLLVEFHYGAFESAETEEIEQKDQKKQTAYSGGLKTQAGLVRTSSLPPNPDKHAAKVEKKNDGALEQKNAQPLADVSTQDPGGQPTDVGLFEAPEVTKIRTAINGNTDSDKTTGSSPSPSSQPVKSTEKPMLHVDAVAPEAGAKAPKEIVLLPALNNRDAKNIDPEENLREQSKTGITSEITRLHQAGLAARNESEADRAAALPPPEPSSSKKKIGMKTLSSSVETRIQAIAPAPENQKKQDNVSSACYITGPIKDVEAFNALLDRFRPQLKDLKSSPAKSNKSRKHSAYIVYSPAPATMERSIYNANILKTEYGIDDLQILKDGELKGAISLGVYSNENNAILAKNRLEQLGIEVEIASPLPIDAFYTIRIRWTKDQTEAAQQLSNTLIKSYSATSRVASCK